MNHTKNLTKKLKIIINVYSELIDNMFIFKSLKFLKNKKYYFLIIVFITTKQGIFFNVDKYYLGIIFIYLYFINYLILYKYIKYLKIIFGVIFLIYKTG